MQPGMSNLDNLDNLDNRVTLNPKISIEKKINMLS